MDVGSDGGEKVRGEQTGPRRRELDVLGSWHR